MTPINTEVNRLIERLDEQMNRSLAVFDGLSAADLPRKDEHGCAVGQTLGGLLAHNIEHDKMHTGQVATKRWELGVMQGDAAARLLAEWYRERAMLISCLIGLPDEALDRRPADGEATIREVIEHVLFWDKDSVDHAALHVLASAHPDEATSDTSCSPLLRADTHMTNAHPEEGTRDTHR